MRTILLIGAATLALTGQAGAKSFLTGDTTTQPFVYNCAATIGNVIDVGDEAQHTTKAVFGTNPGGGEGGQFDKTPVRYRRRSEAWPTDRTCP